MNNLPCLDENCGDNFTYREFIECGDSFNEFHPNNIPSETKTYKCLKDLAELILDPVWQEFGKIELTYGISCPDLFKNIQSRISPPIDQHAGWELNSKGQLICGRGGAAVDFFCAGNDSFVISQWIVKNCPFDRLYFYGTDRPIHVSIGPDESRQVVVMRYSDRTRRRVPRRMSVERFCQLEASDPLITSGTTRTEDAR